MNAQPQPVVSSRNLFLLSPPKMVGARRPASRATFTNCTPSGTPAISWSNEKTGSVAQSDRTKPRRDKAEREVERHLSKDMSTGENVRSYLMLAEPVFSGLGGGGTATSEHFRQGRHRLNAGARLCETKCQSREESRLSRRAACATET